MPNVLEPDATSRPSSPGASETRRTTNITTLVGRLSDVGLKRELDEDALLTTEMTQFAQAGGQIIGLYAVADGMGGASAGEVASKMVTETMAREVTQKIFVPRLASPGVELDYSGILKAAIEQANTDVLSARTHAHSDMGSTVVAALLVGSQAHIANVGDSRAYLIACDAITQITRDHSLVQELAERGAIAEAEMRTHPHRNYILRNVGDKPKVLVDLYQVEMAPGQSLLLCCDGLWGMLSDAVIQAVLASAKTPQDACNELIAAANEAGGRDNITAVIVERVG